MNMAEGQFAETPSSEIITFPQHVGRLSDRAIQRLVGGNAFLRGRIYARRNAVSELQADAAGASCRVLIRADEPIDVSADSGRQRDSIECSCQAWRGPTGHASTSLHCSSRCAIASVRRSRSPRRSPVPRAPRSRPLMPAITRTDRTAALPLLWTMTSAMTTCPARRAVRRHQAHRCRSLRATPRSRCSRVRGLPAPENGVAHGGVAAERQA